MSFGLTNAAGVFQWLIQWVLIDANPKDGPEFVSVYTDDALVLSKTLEEHLHHLKLVLEQLANWSWTKVETNQNASSWDRK